MTCACVVIDRVTIRDQFEIVTEGLRTYPKQRNVEASHVNHSVRYPIAKLVDHEAHGRFRGRRKSWCGSLLSNTRLNLPSTRAAEVWRRARSCMNDPSYHVLTIASMLARHRKVRFPAAKVGSLALGVPGVLSFYPLKRQRVSAAFSTFALSPVKL
jgi:hypothetical protein